MSECFKSNALSESDVCVCLFVSVKDTEGTEKEIESVLFWGKDSENVGHCRGWRMGVLFNIFLWEDRQSRAPLLLLERDGDGESYDCLNLTNSNLEEERVQTNRRAHYHLLKARLLRSYRHEFLQK